MRALILGIAATALATAAGPPEWTAASSDNFELLTTGGARKAKAGIQHFEEVRDFFVKALRFDPKLNTKVRLVAFDSLEEWKRFRPGEAADAFYQPGVDRDTIAMESLRGEVYQIAVHEYVHLLLRHSGGSFPVWLNEGLAELYSSMNVQGGKMRVGDLHVGRYQLLQKSKWLPMEQLLAVDHESPIYKAKAHQGIFYSQSWALAHMLMLGDAYRAKAGEFVTKVAYRDMPPGKAFLDVYGKTLFKVQKDLEDYLNASSIRIVLYDYKPEKPPAPEVRKASLFESDLAVARLLSRGAEPRDAEEIFDRLESQEAANLELAEAYGFHLLYRKKPEEARKRLARAIAASSRNPKTYMQYAFLVQKDSATEAVKALKKAVELEPGDMELRYYLGRMLLQANKPGEALSALVEAKPVPPEHAVGYLEAIAHVYLNFKQPDQARLAANKAEAVAKSEADRQRVGALLKAVDRWEQSASSQKAAEERYRQHQEERAKADASERDTIPVIKRGEKQPAQQEAEPVVSPVYPTVTGKMQRVECMGQRATLHVLTGGKSQRFVIEDPASVVITGAGANGSTAEFSCGPQKDLAVAIGHVDGVVRTLGFL